MATYNPKGANNWGAGKRGFQSALNPCQQVGLLLMWTQNNWKNSVGREFLESRYRVSLPPRTLTAYKSRFKKFWANSKTIDRQADWSDFKKLISEGVPERHLASLHVMWRDIQRICLDIGVIPIKPTYRALKWWSYVAEYHGDSLKTPSDIQIVGDQYMVREMISDVTGDAFTKDDIDMWLMYEPWADQEKLRRYLALIRDQKIISIDWPSNGWGLEIADSVERADQYPAGYGMSVLNWLLATSPEPYLLPSQIIERYSIFARP
tara:strand:+ start:202 stop:993 length:792 start_codon:yes stop_codon:yes gene_type:complete